MAAILFAAGRIDAQIVRGIIMLPDSSRAAGVVVLAADSTGKIAARALTGELGSYELRLPGAGRYDVRVLRIGFRPTEMPTFDIAKDDVRTLSIVLQGEAVVLTAVTVQGQSACGTRSNAGVEVAHMWEAARTAIMATQLSQAGAKQTVQWTMYDRYTDPTGKDVLSQTSNSYSAVAMKAFVSLAPDSLVQVGYMHDDASGTVYRAPDAEALLSDAFASSHCFHLDAPPKDHGDWVGIGFSPNGKRDGIVDIEGTLWLDRTSSELRLLEFRYTNLPAELAHVSAGGNVEFLRLSTGRWLVGRWSVRMPRTDQRSVPHFKDVPTAGDQLKNVVVGLKITGGDVTSVRRGTELLFGTGESTHDFSPALLAEDAKLAASCGADSAKGDLVSLLHGTVFEGEHKAVPGASIRITWRGEYKATGQYSFSYRDERRDLTSNESGSWFLCGIPRERLITVRATIGARASAPATVRIPREKAAAGVDVEIPPQ
jgi:Carboxypeptidase regulatory-like domain